MDKKFHFLTLIFITQLFDFEDSTHFDRITELFDLLENTIVIDIYK
jgi:hypothetical protein